MIWGHKTVVRYKTYVMIKVRILYGWKWCWWLYDGDRFEMLVAESLCWWFFQDIKSVTNILNQSATSQTCHQHQCNFLYVWYSMWHTICYFVNIIQRPNISCSIWIFETFIFLGIFGISGRETVESDLRWDK